MANSRDFTGKNRKFTGTKGIITPKGTTGQRVGSESGELRFNTTTELMEYFDGTSWKPIDAPPTISSITTSDATGSNTVLNADGSTLFTITISGGNFGVGAVVKFIGNTGTEYAALNVNRVSASSITCTTRSNMGTTDDPYDVSVTNASGLAATLEDAFSYNAAPVFVNASGTLGQVYNTLVVSGSTLNASATDAEGNTITYSILSGSLPGSGLSLSSSTGMITGTLSGSPSLGNYSFIVQASTSEGVINRQFSLQVVAIPPVTANFLVLAGGGGGGGDNAGGGGAGGYRTSFGTASGTGNSGGGSPCESTISLNPGTVYTITIGGGGSGGPVNTAGTQGVNSSISGTALSTITSTGGGGGAGGEPDVPATTGGSGGGGNGETPTSGAAGTANQGFAGGNGSNNGGGGGGGAGQVGQNGSSGDVPGNGGNGVSSSITGTGVTRGGGGGGGPENGTPKSSGGLGGSGGGGAGNLNGGSPGGTNLGGGGGGSDSNATGGNGGKGVVILRVPTNRYSSTTTGSPSVTTSGSDTILVYNDSGSYTG